MSSGKTAYERRAKFAEQRIKTSEQMKVLVVRVQLACSAFLTTSATTEHTQPPSTTWTFGEHHLSAKGRSAAKPDPHRDSWISAKHSSSHADGLS